MSKVPQIKKEFEQSVASQIERNTPSLAQFAEIVSRSGNEVLKKRLESASIPEFELVFEKVKNEVRGSESEREEFYANLKKDLNKLFYSQYFAGEVRENKTIDLLKNISKGLNTDDNEDLAISKNIEKAISDFSQKENKFEYSNKSNVGVSLDYLEEIDQDVYNNIIKNFDVSSKGVTTTGSDEDIAEVINAGLNKQIQDNHEFLKKEAKRQEQVLSKIDENDDDAIQAQQEKLENIYGSIKALEEVQKEVFVNAKKNPNVKYGKVQAIEADIIKNSERSLEDLEDTTNKTNSIFGQLRQGASVLGTSLQQLESISGDLLGTFEDIGSGNMKGAQNMQQAMGLVSNMLLAGTGVFGVLFASVGLAGLALKNFHEDLDVARNYGGGSAMVKDIQTMHTTTLMDPQQLSELSSVLSTKFSISLAQNRKETENIAIKQRLSERVMGKAYAEQQMEALGDLKNVLSETTVAGKMDELQSSTLALAKTMNISNDVALEQIKALAENTKKIGETLDKSQQAVLQDQFESMAAGLKNMGFSPDNIATITASMEEVYSEEGSRTAVNNAMTLMNMDPATVEAVAKSVGAGSSKEMLNSLNTLSMAGGDVNKAVMIMMKQNPGMKPEEALKQINASVLAQKVAGEKMFDMAKEQKDLNKVNILTMAGYKDGVLGAIANQENVLEKFTAGTELHAKVMEGQKVMPKLNKLFLGMGARNEDEKNELLKGLIKNSGKTDEIDALVKKGLTEQQAYASVMAKDIQAAAETMEKGEAVKLGNEKISAKRAEEINKMDKNRLAEEIGLLDASAAEISKDRAEKAATEAMYALYDAVLPFVSWILPKLAFGIEMLGTAVTFVSNHLIAFGVAIAAGFALFKLFPKQIGGIFSPIKNFFKKILPSRKKIDVGDISKSTKRISSEGNNMAQILKSISSKIKNSFSGIGGKKEKIGMLDSGKRERGGLIKRRETLPEGRSTILGKTMNRLNKTMINLIKSINRLIREMGGTSQAFEDFDFDRDGKRSKSKKDRTKRRTKSSSRRSSRLQKFKTSATGKLNELKSIGTGKLSGIKSDGTDKLSGLRKSTSDKLSGIKSAGTGKLSGIKSAGSSFGSKVSKSAGKMSSGLMSGMGKLGSVAGKLAGPIGLAFTAFEGITGAMDGWKNASDWFASDLEKQTKLLSTASPEAQKYAESISKTGTALWDGTKYVDEFGNTIEAQPSFLQKSASAIGGAIESLSFGLLDGQMIAKATAGIFSWFGDIMEKTGLSESFAALGTVFKNIGSTLLDVGKSIISFLQPTFESIKTVFIGIIGSIKGAVDIIVGVLTLDGEKIIGGIKSAFGGLFDIILSPFNAVLGYIDKIFGTGLLGIFTSIKDSIFGVVGGYFDVITAPFKSIMSWFSGEISFTEIFSDAWNTAKEGLGKMFGGIKDMIFEPFKMAINGIKKLLSFIPGFGGNEKVDAVLETKGTATEQQKEMSKDVSKQLGIEKGVFGYKELGEKELKEKAEGLSTEEIKAIIASDAADNTNLEQLAEILVDRESSAKPTEEKEPAQLEVTSVPAKAEGGSTGGIGDEFAKMIMTSGTETPVATVGTDEFVFSKDMISEFMGLKNSKTDGSEGKIPEIDGIKFGTEKEESPEVFGGITKSLSTLGFGAVGNLFGSTKKEKLDEPELISGSNEDINESLTTLGDYLLQGFNMMGMSLSTSLEKGNVISSEGFKGLSELSENLLNTTEEVNEDGTTVRVVTPVSKTNELLDGILNAISNLKVMGGYSPEEGLGDRTSDIKSTKKTKRATKEEKKAAKQKFEASGNFVKDVAKHIFKAETGKAEGGYDAAKDIGDGAGISFGAYQLTEKSGGVEKYLKSMAAQGDTTADTLSKQMKGGWFQGDKSQLTDYLKKSGDTESGRAAQDKIFSNEYLKPALKIAEQNNITDKAAIAQVIDHSVNAGVGGARRMVRKAEGDFSAKGLADARKKDYSGLKSFDKYGKGWFNRVNHLTESFKTYEGKSITDDKKQKKKIATKENTKPSLDTIIESAKKVVTPTTGTYIPSTISKKPSLDAIIESAKKVVTPTTGTYIPSAASKKPLDKFEEGIIGNIKPGDISSIPEKISSQKELISPVVKPALSLTEQFSKEGPKFLKQLMGSAGIGDKDLSKINISDTLVKLKDFGSKSIGNLSGVDLEEIKNTMLGTKTQKTPPILSKSGGLARGATMPGTSGSIPNNLANIPSGFSGSTNNVTNNNMPTDLNVNLENMMSELLMVNKQQLGHLGTTAKEAFNQTRQAHKNYKAQIDRNDNFRQHDISNNRNMVLK